MIHWNVGSYTNTRVEAMALWGLLWFTYFLNIPDIHIFGDSKIIADHVNGYADINQPMVLGLLRRIDNQRTQLRNPSIKHIGREHNQLADELSKKGLQGNLGDMHIDIILDGNVLNVKEFPFRG